VRRSAGCTRGRRVLSKKRCVAYHASSEGGNIQNVTASSGHAETSGAGKLALAENIFDNASSSASSSAQERATAPNSLLNACVLHCLTTSGSESLYVAITAECVTGILCAV
jgi:hypothetical protein